MGGSAWTTIGNANGAVYALAVHGGELYAGGTFTSINGVAASKIARWDGASWHAVGAGLPGTVEAIVGHGTMLVAGGSQASYQGVAQWDGASWTQLGAGLQNGVSAGTVKGLASDGVTLYACGTFNSSGGSPVTNVAAWNGSAWSSFAGANVDSRAVALYGGNPMATVLDGSVRRPQLWNGSAWQTFNQANVEPESYALDGATLYAGGYPSPSAGGLGATPTTIESIWSFDGSAWAPVQEAWTPDMKGINGGPIRAQAWQGSLFVGGDWWYVGAGDHYQYALGLARWDGADWNATDQSRVTYGFAVWNDSLVAAMADFSVKVWTGSTWRKLKPPQATNSFSDRPWDVLVYQGDLYALGPSYSGATDLNGVGRWTGNDWVPVGSGVGVDDFDTPWVGTEWSGHLVIGGYLTTAGGAPVRNLAYWDGSAYHELGGGVNDFVACLLADGADLVVGGDFTEAGGESLQGVARWDGAQWHAMGTRARALSGLRSHAGRIYAAGDFLDDNGDVVAGAAIWTGTDWRLLGSGCDPIGVAKDLEFVGDDLYLVGSFNRANGQPARCFARLPNAATLDVPGGWPLPTRLALAPSPNPARGAVRFSVTLPAAGRARLVIHDVAGREVARLLDGSREAGAFTLPWEARVAPGLYFATLGCAGERATTRVVRLK